MSDRIPEDVLNALYPAVGGIVITWAFAESILDKWVAIIYRAAEGRSLKGYKKLPSQDLTTKVAFLRDAFATIPPLAPSASEGKRLLDIASSVARIRHVIVHGVIADFDPQSKSVRFVRLNVDRKLDIHRQRDDRLTFEQLLDANAQIQGLIADGMAVAQQLLDRFSGNVKRVSEKTSL